jgi:citrate synthase
MTYSRKTNISRVEPETITIRGHSVGDLIGNISFGKAIYLLLLGKMPTENQSKMLEGILVSVIDHGVRPPSTIAAVTAANTGAPLNSAVAAGILAINEFHGGAIEKAMLAVSEGVKLQQTEGLDRLQAAEKLVENHKTAGTRISGFGHRFHKADPRTARLFDLAKELNIAGIFFEQSEAISDALSKKLCKNMPINADGAIAALLCELEFPPKIANGIFMIARVPGLIAHVVEEQENNPPMRTVDVENYEFED